jgi:transposase
MPINELKIKNTSLLMALSVFGIINYNTTLESIDTNIYFNFIDDTIKKLKKINPTTIFIFIFDNVSFHKDNRIYDLIINNGYKIYYIPPYSPNLNPIENTFGILKNEINNDILNDIVNNNFFNNYDKTKKENNENIKKSNKNLKIEEKKKEALKILEFKENNKKEFNNLINVQITNIKKDKNIEKKEINEKIKEIKVKNKEEKYLKQKEYITNEKNNTKIRILNNKTPKSTILKKYIENNIKKFNEKYKKEQILKIYEHAFNYEYQDIEKELRDRIKIKK